MGETEGKSKYGYGGDFKRNFMTVISAWTA